MSTDYTQRPTLTSTAIALALTVVTVGLVLGQARLVIRPALIASAGALAFAASLWLADGARLPVVPAVLMSLLTVPIAAGLLVGTGGTVLLLVEAFFPVQTVAQLSTQSLRLLARVGIVIGTVLAVFGIALGIRNVLDGRTLARHYWVAVKTAVVPAATGTLMLGSAILTKTSASAQQDVVPLESTVQWLLAPGSGRTHLATLLALGALAVLVIRATIDALPVAELLGDSGVGETENRQIQTATGVLGWVVVVTALAAVVTFFIESLTTPTQLEQNIGPSAVRSLEAISTAAGLRLVLVWLVGLGLPTLLLIWTVRRLARSNTGSALRRLAPLVGGAVLTAGALTVGSPILTGLVSWVAARLPTAFATPFREVTDATIEFYGAPALVVTGVAMLVAVTASIVLTLRFALLLGYLSGETAGYSLSSGGLFVASAFAAVVGAPTWLVFGGLVASILVWDAGRYGTVLGREVGRDAGTRTAELVHAGGTLAVGLVGIGVATAIRWVLGQSTLPQTATATAALVGVLAGLVLLVAALR